MVWRFLNVDPQLPNHLGVNFVAELALLKPNPKPDTRNSKPETRNPKPETLNPKPYSKP